MGKSAAVYQLKITLSDVKPPIWRRIEVKDCTLSTLNDIIQTVMGWDGYHLWAFDIGGEQYGEDPDGEMDMASASKTKLSQVVQSGVKKFRYTYDFGDNWDHVIQVEKVLETNGIYLSVTRFHDSSCVAFPRGHFCGVRSTLGCAKAEPSSVPSTIASWPLPA